MFDLKAYAQKFRVPLVHDECDELVIPGRYGHIYAHSATQLGWCLTNTETARLKNLVIRHYVRAGRAVLHGEGDTEAIFLFDPKDTALFRDFLRRCGVPRKSPRAGRGVPEKSRRRKRPAVSCEPRA